MAGYNKIFRKREFKAILGEKYANFWILLVAFLLAIGSLSFGQAGLDFLSRKMNDPFIKWIQVKEQGDFERFSNDVQQPGFARDKFDISTIETNNFILEYVFTTDFKKCRVEGRTIAPQSQLLPKILDGDNTVVNRQMDITSLDYGWIVTRDLMKNLGYEEDNYPLFLNYTYKGDSDRLDSLGIENYDRYMVIPIPIIAVVKQLPDLLDFIAPQYFKYQLESSDNPFNVSLHDQYYHDLVLVVEHADEEVERQIDETLHASGLVYDANWMEVAVNYDQALRSATKYRIIVRDTNVPALNAVAKTIAEMADVYRVYDYAFGRDMVLNPDYMSFMFEDLNDVQAFAKWAKNSYGVRIDMAQIEAKNNFNIFNQLANGLCIAIIAISVGFIIIFLWFLINAHFRKISKNLGTIMAFGLENRSIVRIYLRVFMKLILLGLVAAVGLLFVLQYAMEYMGFVRVVDGICLSYIDMLDGMVLGVIGGIIVLSALVIWATMRNKLKATPGDLIFERNK